MTTVLEQIEATESLIAADERIITSKQSEWASACASGAMPVALQCEADIEQAKRSIARLQVRRRALEDQAGSERAAAKQAEVAHLKAEAVKLGDQFMTELGNCAHAVSVVTDRTYALADLAFKVGESRRTAAAAGVIFDVAFNPKERLQQVLKDAQNNEGNVANCLRTDWH